MPVSVVTGGTGGIGRWIALGLLHAGHRVVVIGRDPARGEQARAWLHSRAPDGALDLMLVDLSSIAATRLAGMRIDARYPAIDVLVNNAGIFSTRRILTDEGLESVLATNHLAAFTLTRALIPALRQAATASGEARIVNIGSSTSDRATIDLGNLQGEQRWSMVRAYSQSKLAMMMTTFGWSRRLQGTGVVANIVHPGTVASNLVRARGPVGLGWRVMAPFISSEEQGADSPLHVALAPEFATITAAYVKRRRQVRPNRLALDPDLVEQTWLATERLADG